LAADRHRKTPPKHRASAVLLLDGIACAEMQDFGKTSLKQRRGAKRRPFAGAPARGRGGVLRRPDRPKHEKRGSDRVAKRTETARGGAGAGKTG